MANAPDRLQKAHLYEMLESAVRIREYMAGISYDEFWDSAQQRDAVAMRRSVMGEAARKIDASSERALPNIPFKKLRGMRNRITHDYDRVNFKVVWTITQTEIEPLIGALNAYFAEQA